MSNVSQRIVVDATKFVDPTLFGEAATYWLSSTLISTDHNEVITDDTGRPLQIDNAPSTSINVVFIEAFEQPAPLGIGHENTGPSAITRTADVANAARNDVLLVGGVYYYVLKAQKDGTGLTLLELSRTVQ